MHLTALALIVYLATYASVAAEVVPAEPRWKGGPEYPAACLPEDVDAVTEDRVDVAFIISSEGLTENVRIMRSTDPCFEEAALAAVRSWTYKPRRVDGRARDQEDMEATFIFEYRLQPPVEKNVEPAPSTETRALVFDAQPKKRVPPRYPDRCFRKAYREEIVVIKFDVTASGNTQNQEVIETTNECFNDHALRSVEKWTYEPKTIDGVPTDRVGVITQIKFVSDIGDVRPENVIRPTIASRLNRARRLLKQEKAEQALALLADFEGKYGDSLSPAELAEFHRIRGLARLGVKDHEGALDDFRTAKRLSVDDPQNSLQNVIDRLEAALNIPSESSPTESPAQESPASE